MSRLGDKSILENAVDIELATELQEDGKTILKWYYKKVAEAKANLLSCELKKVEFLADWSTNKEEAITKHSYQHQYGDISKNGRN